MVHRIALIVGGLCAAGILALALSTPGLVPPQPLADATATDAPVPATAAPRRQVDTVYVEPVPRQRVIHVSRQDPQPKPQPVRVVRSRTADDEEHEGEHEREGSHSEHGGDD